MAKELDEKDPKKKGTDAASGQQDTGNGNPEDAADTEGGKEGTAAAEQKQQDTAGKTYDEAYVKALEEKHAKELQEKVDEAVKKAGMSDDEKTAYEQNQHISDLDQREQALMKKELQSEARELLAENKLPISFLDMVVSSDKEMTEQNIKSLRAEFDKAVQAQVEERLKGKTPNTGTGDDGKGSTIDAEIDKYL